MWDMEQSCETSAKEQLQANYRSSTQDALVSAVPHIYYSETDKPIIVDKCRSWTIPANLDMLFRYVDKQPKIIVLERDVDEIVTSFAKLRKANGWTKNPKEGLLDEGSEPIMRSLAGVKAAKASGMDCFLFLSYDDLVKDTEAVLNKIYEFCGWDEFTHNLTSIENLHPERDEVYGLIGQHDIRPTIGFR